MQLLPFGSLVTLLEILRAYADAYAESSFTLAMAACKCDRDEDALESGAMLGIVQGQLEKLLKHCEHLPVTAVKVQKILKWLQHSELMKQTIGASSLAHSLAEIQDRLVDELSTKLFFQLPYERHKLFMQPTAGWEEVVTRWPDVQTDVEEMSRCFALSRYPASVFHSIQAIESGLIHLGKFLAVPDPKSGWTAVSNQLEKFVVKMKRSDLDPLYQTHFAFLEQTHASVSALKSAWRNKISHSQGRLILMTNSFPSDVAEEIIIASRSFMRRLATEMPV